MSFYSPILRDWVSFDECLFLKRFGLRFFSFEEKQQRDNEFFSRCVDPSWFSDYESGWDSDSASDLIIF